MTTQATQSNNALGRRTSPSSFFAPLQTLGLNLDRRKNSGRPFDAMNANGGTAGQESPVSGKDKQDDRNNRNNREVRDNRDIRTASRDTGEAQVTAGRTAAAFGLKDDFLSPATAERQNAYPARDREPDPELVREAISRLAREYAMPETDADASLPAGSFRTAPARPDARNNSVSAQSAFAEVARRVWAGADPERAASPQPTSQVQFQSYSAQDQSGSRRDAELKDPELEDLEVQNLERADFQRADFEQADLERVDKQPPSYSAATASLYNLEPDSRLESRLNSRLGTVRGLDEARALAHDAGNLLSALRLYGDLLCFSGVLHERHRHYAIDLKLLSLRSESLIDRLLTLADQVALADYTVPTPVQAKSPISVQASAYGSADSVAPAAPQAVSSNGSDSVPHRSQGYNLNLTSSHGFEAGQAEGEVETEETSSLAETLTRLRGLLGTIAHGTLDLDAGDQGALEIAAPGEVVERILINLVSNAAAAVRGGGGIRIRAGIKAASGAEAARAGGSSTDSLVVLTVDDSGCGMSEAQIRRALSLDRYGDSPGDPSDPENSDLENSHLENSDLENGDQENSYRKSAVASVQDQQPGSQKEFPRNRMSRDSSFGAAERQHGLGLLIVRDLVASTGGRLFIHSRQGTGTRMEIQWKAVGASSLDNDRAGEVGQIGTGYVRNLEYSREDSRWAAAPAGRPDSERELRPGFIATDEAALNRTGLRVETPRTEGLRTEGLRSEKKVAHTNVAKGAVA